MSEREILTYEHEAFRRTVRSFIEKEVTPHHAQWETDGQVSREVWTRAGAQGLLCFDVAVEYGGPGVQDFRTPRRRRSRAGLVPRRGSTPRG